MAALTFDEMKKKNLRTENLYAYARLHLWVNRQLGKASICTNDPSHSSKRYHWANISGYYKKDLMDWRQLCASCNISEGVTDTTREIKRLQATGNTNRRKAIIQHFPGGSWLRHSSIKHAAQIIGVSHTGLIHALKGRTKTIKGYRWTYAEGEL